MLKTTFNLIFTLIIQIISATALITFLCCLLSSCNSSKVVYEIGTKYKPMQNKSLVTGFNYSTIK